MLATDVGRTASPHNEGEMVEWAGATATWLLHDVTLANEGQMMIDERGAL